VSNDHGKLLEWAGYSVVATIHPSATLRATEPEERERLRRLLVEDLRTAARLVG
jgi:uracil-DNA glycosylase